MTICNQELRFVFVCSAMLQIGFTPDAVIRRF